MEPAAKVAPLGLMATETSVAELTLMTLEPEMEPTCAVMLAMPGATAVTRPVLLTVAIDVDWLVQVAVELRFCVLPSE